MGSPPHPLTVLLLPSPRLLLHSPLYARAPPRLNPHAHSHLTPPAPAAASNGSGADVPPNVKEAREWIAAWKAKQGK